MAKMKDIQAALVAVLKDVSEPKNIQKYAEQAASMIKLRTRLGMGVSKDGGDKKALKKLASSTKVSRVRKSKTGKLSSDTSPGKSNLTETGQLLDSIEVISISKGQVRIGPKGKRRDGLSNPEVAGYVTAQGRPFNNLSKVEIKRIQDQMTRDLNKLTKGRLTRTKK